MQHRRAEVRNFLRSKFGDLVTEEMVQAVIDAQDAEKAESLKVTTPCIVCATKARLKNSPFFASRGMDWPTTEVAGHQAHLCCSSEAEHLAMTVSHGILLIDGRGIGRWSTNDRVIPEDCAALLKAMGLAPSLDTEATRRARDTEAAMFLRDYRANPPIPDIEQLAEMRARQLG